MTELWLDRRKDVLNAKGITHCLVIGISAYPKLPAKGEPDGDPRTTLRLHKVSTTASSAFRFARWLSNQYMYPDAPLATIDLLLSPSTAELASDDELKAVAPSIRIPDRATTQEAVIGWRDRCRGNQNGIAMLYVAGHGFQYTSYDPFILLDDFGSGEFPMDNSIDVGRVHRGMAGSDLPVTQFFFVDACRSPQSHPVELAEESGGVALHTDATVDERVAPIFFGAVPGETSWGQPGKGTIFVRALIDVLDDPQWYESDAKGQWGLQSSRLVAPLERKVQELAGEIKESQLIDVGGRVRSRPINFLPGPPTVPFKLHLDPLEAKPVSRVMLRRDAEDGPFVFDERGFDPYPVEWDLPVGLYSFDVLIQPPTDPYVARVGHPINALPGRPVERTVRVHD